MKAENKSCRSCGDSNLELILSLGKTPLANSLLSKDKLEDFEPTFPLELVYCPKCALVQITETVTPEKLFLDYIYFSSFSETMLKHAETLVHRLTTERGLNEKSLVVELASNDGYLLQYYHRKGVPVLGIEPALNIAKVASEKNGIRTISEFFDEDLANKLKRQGELADVIHAHNVLAHVADLNGFVEGIRVMLKDDGIALIEVPYLRDLIDNCEFDTIYHEHLCYYSLTALDSLFKKHGLIIYDAARIPIHGGSLRLFISKTDAAAQSDNVIEMLKEEEAWGANNLEFYLRFAKQVESLKSLLLNLLQDLKSDGKRLAAYGAAAKGSTLLNFFGIGSDFIDFVVDRSTYKQGNYMPGVHLPIYPPEKLLESKPDYVLMLTWNFASEILAQQADYRRQGGRFIIPIPKVEIV